MNRIHTTDEAGALQDSAITARPHPAAAGAAIAADGLSLFSRPDALTGREISTVRDEDWQEAQARANLCQEFQRLTAGGLSLRQAAMSLGKSPSVFSGEDSILAQFRRGGVAALLPVRRAPGAKQGTLSAQIEALTWFLPAARFFYLLTNRTWKSGSVPEAVRRTISLPHLPAGWDAKTKGRFFKAIGMELPPVCPVELREAIIAREKAGQAMVPETVARRITVNAATVRQYRNPTNAALDFLNSPGGMRLFDDGNGLRLARAGEIMEADDATINFPVCVPWRNGGDPCSEKFGVRVGRFQWLVSIDAGTSFITGFNYTMRPRSSYRGEDVLSLIRSVCSQHGIPRRWRLEQGVWKSNLVTAAIRNLGSQLDTVYSPHQKPFIEGLFNTLWTKLSVHFPGAHVGRFMGEHEEANDLLTACQRGNKDPRKYFPMLTDALAAFHEVIAEKNRTPVNSQHHGRWIPEERWAAELAQPRLDAGSAWMFSPFVREWTVKGMVVGGRVPLFEDLSVPFDFSAPWLPQYDGVRVKCYFDPRALDGAAKICLAQDLPGRRIGEVLGDAEPLSDTSGYVRFVMGWAQDPGMHGALARQQAAAAMRSEVRAVVPNGRAGYSRSEERDGVATVTTAEKLSPGQTGPNQPSRPASPAEMPAPEGGRCPGEPFDRAARARELEEFEQKHAHLFV